jgi:hypothetical protein
MIFKVVSSYTQRVSIKASAQDPHGPVRFSEDEISTLTHMFSTLRSMLKVDEVRGNLATVVAYWLQFMKKMGLYEIENMRFLLRLCSFENRTHAHVLQMWGVMQNS